MTSDLRCGTLNIHSTILGGIMKKSFLKPFAVTLGTLLATTSANAAAEPVSAISNTEISSSRTVAGGDLLLQHAATDVQYAAHGSHASHASHSSHSSHASSAY